MSSSDILVQLADGRVVGQIVDRIMQKRVIFERHFYRKLRAWCLSAEALLKYRGQFDWVELTDMENGIQYRLHVDQIDRLGEDINEGHGAQIAVRRKHWQTAPARFYQGSLL